MCDGLARSHQEPYTNKSTHAILEKADARGAYYYGRECGDIDICFFSESGRHVLPTFRVRVWHQVMNEKVSILLAGG